MYVVKTITIPDLSFQCWQIDLIIVADDGNVIDELTGQQYIILAEGKKQYIFFAMLDPNLLSSHNINILNKF